MIVMLMSRSPKTSMKLQSIEDRLANSDSMRLLARTLIRLFQRGTWELKQIKDAAPRIEKIEIDTRKVEEAKKKFADYLKKLDEDLKKKL